MKILKFRYLFVFSSWIIFFATGRSVVGSVLLVVSGIYLLIEE